MSFYTPFAYFVIVTAVLAFAGTPVFSGADIVWHDETPRTSTLDGLRGFLATGVFFHHAAIYYLYLLTGIWQLPPSYFYTQLGQSGVSLFFMITGYLFWGKAIRACGRFDWRALYLGRIFRIAPLYYLAVLLMLYAVFRQTHFMLLQPPLTLMRQIAPLALFGFKNPAPIINTYPSPGLILAGVTWTLHYEWLFYLILLPASA
ncbi:MAG TPA: acyltransferase family protein, partial [Burkholderiales bacterium]|nr:acyltransferase family protein [Burkholderiales bacterium]